LSPLRAQAAKCKVALARAVPPDVTPREAYNRLLNISIEIAYLDTMISLSDWDQSISMPPNATEYRAKAQSYLVQYFTNWIRKSSGFIPISKYFSVKCLKS
jgi:hypothetical protein